MIGFPMRSRRGEEQGKRAPLNYFTLPLNGAKEPGEKNKTNEPAVSCRHLKTYQPECGHKKHVFISHRPNYSVRIHACRVESA